MTDAFLEAIENLSRFIGNTRSSTPNDPGNRP